MGVVRASVAASEVDAELACSVLREQGIKCFFKESGDVGSSIFGTGFSTAGAPFEIWVDESDAERAQELLAE